MKLSKEDIQGIAELLGEAETFKPMVKNVLGVIKTYAVELDEPLKELQKWSIQCRIDSIQQYKDAGFSQQEAILLTLDGSQSLRKVLNQYSKKS